MVENVANTLPRSFLEQAELPLTTAFFLSLLLHQSSTPPQKALASLALLKPKT